MYRSRILFLVRRATQRPGLGLGHPGAAAPTYRLGGGPGLGFFAVCVLLTLGPYVRSAVGAAPPAAAGQLQKEPTAAVLIALAQSQLPQAESDSLARWAAALPTKLGVQVRQDDESDWSGTVYDDDGWRHRLGGGKRLWWRVDAEWSLSRLLYNPDRTVQLRLERQHRIDRQAMADEVSRLYYQRRKLQLRWLIAPPTESVARIQLWTDISELTTRLDGLTDAGLSRAAVAWWKPPG